VLAHPAKECISCLVCVCSVCVHILFSLPLSPPPSLPPAQATRPTLDTLDTRGVGRNACQGGVGRNALLRSTRDTSDNSRHLRRPGARRPGTLAPSCRATLEISRDAGGYGIWFKGLHIWFKAPIRMLQMARQ